MLKMFDPTFLLQCRNRACLKPEVVDRLVFLAKNMLNRQQAHTLCPVHLPTCDVHCSMQMFNLVYVSSGIQNTVCKQKAPFAKKVFNETLYQYQYGN